MKKLLLAFFILAGVSCFGQVETEYQRYQREQEEQMKAMKMSDSINIKNLEKEYEEYVIAETKAYNEFVKKMEGLWGKNNVIESTQKDWVEYSNDGKTRSNVDFEKGEATIEIVIEPEEKVDNKVIEKKVEEGIKELVENKGTTKDYDSSKEKAQPLQSTPILQNQIETPSGQKVTEKNIDKAVVEIVKNVEPEVKTIKGSDGKERKVVTVKLDLAPDHIKTRAEKYKNEIEKYCRKYDIDPAMAYAVMQTESSFNPKAKSYVPAYGLMQIVPTSAGKDCAQSLKKSFIKPTANYLYEPENNVEMGIHYLYLLKKRYFKDVNDINSQNLCMIASYNTGAGNLARALRGDTKISKAIPQINEMSYDQLFKYLEKKLLPETQNYIRNVTKRMNDFKKWMN